MRYAAITQRFMSAHGHKPMPIIDCVCGNQKPGKHGSVQGNRCDRVCTTADFNKWKKGRPMAPQKGGMGKWPWMVGFAPPSDAIGKSFAEYAKTGRVGISGQWARGGTMSKSGFMTHNMNRFMSELTPKMDCMLPCPRGWRANSVWAGLRGKYGKRNSKFAKYPVNYGFGKPNGSSMKKGVPTRFDIIFDAGKTGRKVPQETAGGATGCGGLSNSGGWYGQARNPAFVTGRYVQVPPPLPPGA